MRIAYVGLYRVHEDNASLHRVVGIARSLQHAGHEVLVAGGDSPTRGERELAPGIIGIGAGDADPQDSMAQKVSRLWRAGAGALRWLDSLDPSPDCVVLYGGGAPFANRIRRWCQRHGSLAVVDLVEWYDGSHMPLGRFGPHALQNELAMRRSYRRMRNVIAISSYLENYYRSRSCNVIRVPPTLDVMNLKHSRQADREQGKVRLVYAGTPGKKDLLGPMLQGLQTVDPEGKHFRFDVIGMDDKALKAVREEHRVVHAPAVAMGRVSRDEVLREVAGADFVPLLRTNARYAQAGFPTKLVESLSLGTPMVCNLTSDIGDHVRDGETGIVVKGTDSDSFADALRRIVSMSDHDLTAMRAETRTAAERAFDFRNYAGPLNDWLADLQASPRARP